MTSVPGKGLRFEGGYVHKDCGGAAERSLPPYDMAYCLVCKVTVPVAKVEKCST